MNLIIQKQEETIAQLQLAVEHYLESGDLETAHQYSELFKINCEAYKALVGNAEVKEEKPQFVFGYGKKVSQEEMVAIRNERERQRVAEKIAYNSPQRQAQKDYRNRMCNPYVFSEETVLQSMQPTQLNYENQMRSQYAQQQPQGAFVPQQAVASQYSYGDGQDNPKIRAGELGSDISRRSWNINGEPNEIITPPQESISRYIVDAPSEDDNLWGEDPRRNINNGFVPQ